MNKKLITPPTVYPISLNEAKKQLRIATGPEINVQLIPSASYETVQSAVLEVLGIDTTIKIDVGTVGTSLVVVIQDSNDGLTYTTVKTLTTITPSNDNTIVSYNYVNAKRYIKVVTTPTGSCNFGILTEQSNISDEDAVIASLIAGATAWAENYCMRKFCTQTWELYLDKFPKYEIKIPYPPLVSVTSIKYIDCLNSETTLSTSDYIVETSGYVGSIVPAYGKSWANAILIPVNGVIVRFVCGYGGSSDVPQDIKRAILVWISSQYNDPTSSIPEVCKSLLANYRVWSV